MSTVPIPKVAGSASKPTRVTIDDFKAGYNSYLDEVRESNGTLSDAMNVMLDQDGVVKKRWGTNWFGDALEGVIDGDDKYTTIQDGKLIEKNIAVVEGQVWTALDGKNWAAASGVNLTAGNDVSMLHIEDNVFLANGKDKLAYYDIAANTVRSFTPIDTPGAPTLERSADLSDGNINLHYRISAVNEVGETAAGPSASITVNTQRENWKNIDADSTTTKEQNIELTWDQVEGAVRYNIYYSDQADNEVFIDSIGDSGNAQTSYTDEGKSAPNTVLAAPIDDTTGGPVLGQISYSDNRIFGTKDPNNPYRVYWGGVGNNTTAFSSFFGGGWVDIGRGGGEIPSKVQSYQNGKGEAINTVFMIDAGSTGSQTQITLSTMTVGTTTFIVPMIARVIGSLGTPAPDSIIEAKNNLFYMNTQGVFTTGMKAELLNSLSTDEVALAIRDEIRRINNQYANKIAGTDYEGKLFFALPYGNSENSTVAVLDLALKSWMWGWNLPVKKFIKYTGSDGVQRLLYRPSGAAADSSRLVELSKDYNNDCGLPFQWSFKTNLISFDSSHFAFMKVDKVYLEFLKADGAINIVVSGTKKNKAFDKLKAFAMAAASSSSAGYDYELYDEAIFDWSDIIPTIKISAQTKKVVKVGKTLNNVQIAINGNSLTDFALSVISIFGRVKKVGDPSKWKK